MAYISTLFLNGITYAGLLFVVASGLTLVYGLMRVVNMAHGSLYITGACLGYMIYKALGDNWTFAFLGAGVALTIICFILQLVVYDRAFNKPALGVLLSLGISWIAIDICNELTRGETKAFNPEGIFRQTFAIGELTYPVSRLVVLAVAVVECIILVLILKKTKIGQIIRAGVDDRDIVSALGINIHRVFLGVFAASGFLVGIAGVLGGTLSGFSIFDAGNMQMYALMVIIVGGSGNIIGTAIAAAIIGLLNSFTMAYIPNFSTVIVFLFVMTVLVFKPQGLFGREARQH